MATARAARASPCRGEKYLRPCRSPGQLSAHASLACTSSLPKNSHLRFSCCSCACYIAHNRSWCTSCCESASVCCWCSVPAAHTQSTSCSLVLCWSNRETDSLSAACHTKPPSLASCGVLRDERDLGSWAQSAKATSLSPWGHVSAPLVKPQVA